jgi:S1-C subfamily serine protease
VIDPEGAGSPPEASTGSRRAGAVVALVVIAAIVSGAVSAGVTLAILHAQSRTNPQTVDLGSNVHITEDSAIIQVADKAAPAVATIVTGSSGPGTGLGSGFLTTSDGYIVTNAHVVANATGLTVFFAGDATRHDARLVDSDCQTDVAVLKVDGVSGRPTLVFGDATTLRVGQSVVVVGTPLGGRVVEAGIVAALHRAISVAGPVSPTSLQTLSDTFQTDAVTDPAISGAPVLNVAGQVVGVAVDTSSGGRETGFALSAQDVQTEVEQIVRDGRLVVPTLGLTTAQVTAADAALKGTSPGAQVITLTPDGPAQLAGIQPADVVTAVDEVKLDDAHPLQQVLIGQFRQGQRVTITLQRGGSTTQVQATLGGGHPECP